MSLRLRTKRFLAFYGRVVAVVLLVVGFGAVAGAGYVYTHPPTERVTEETNAQRVHTELATSATVTGNSTLYERGELLENQPAYVLNATPTLEFTARTGEFEGESATVDHRVTVRLAATRDGGVFWEERLLLVGDSPSVADGEAVSTGSADMRELGEYVANRRSQIGDVGEFTSEIRIHTTYDTGRYSGRLTASAPLVFTPRAYWISGDLSESRTHSEPETRAVTRPPNATASLGLSAVGALSLLGALATAYVGRQDVDVYEIERELAESEYDEWISAGQIPTDPDRKYIAIDSLEDLVDIAIDSDKRVIHDSEYRVYSVTDGDLVYYYSHGEFDVDSWLNM